jgi:hypothetical protein
MLAAGVYMLVIGLGMTGKVSWAARLTPRPPRLLINALSKLRRKASTEAAAGESTLATPIAFGLLTGLMPCAPLMAAEIAAASSGDPLSGGFIMLAFGLGTLPLLFAFGTASSLIPHRWKQRLTFVLAFVVMALGLVFINRTAMLMGFPVNSHSIQAAILGTPPPPAAQSSADYSTAADGVVEVQLTVSGGGFQPADLQIPSDKPVRLLVNRVGDDFCSQQLVFPKLGIQQDLAPNGLTAIDLPATAAGSYTMTCGMGMLAGRLLAGSVASGGGWPSWYWLAVTLTAIAGAFCLALGIAPRRAPVPRPALAAAGPGLRQPRAVVPTSATPAVPEARQVAPVENTGSAEGPAGAKHSARLSRCPADGPLKDTAVETAGRAGRVGPSKASGPSHKQSGKAGRKKHKARSTNRANSKGALG